MRIVSPVVVLLIWLALSTAAFRIVTAQGGDGGGDGGGGNGDGDGGGGGNGGDGGGGDGGGNGDGDGGGGNGDGGGGGGEGGIQPPKEAQNCEGVFISYNFDGRRREYPYVKNVSAQAWSFRAHAMVLNTGTEELKSWKLYIGFHHRELLVGLQGAAVIDADGFPIPVGTNGTILAGFPQADLKTAADTASDLTKMGVQIRLRGSQFGVGQGGTPMPKTIRLANDGYQCRPPTGRGGNMHACCRKDPKYKEKDTTKTKFSNRQNGDLSLAYDVIRAYDNRYLVQVTIDNNNPLGRLDQWNLTWDWMRNEFINYMKGAYTIKKDTSECIYGPQGRHYKDLDFSTVINCQKRPVIADLPPDKEADEKVGKLPYCCKNGTLLPKMVNETRSKAVFQLEVQKLPPDLKRTAIYPPQNWKIEGRLNPTYKCGPPMRIDADTFPDPAGLPAKAAAVASWQVICNMTKPKPKESKCCVSYSGYYSDGVIPCSTCACGCNENSQCDTNGAALHLPPNALLVPFDNRTVMAKAFAKLKKKSVPARLPCPDNCGVSINWHIDADYKTGWTARMTLFNWQKDMFQNWSMAVEMKKAYPGFEKVYSFNGTKMEDKMSTIFMQGMPGQTALLGLANASKPNRDPKVPGKQQTVIQFNKKHTPNIDVVGGAGFPDKIMFNGAECALPKELPKRSNAHHSSPVGLIPAFFVVVLTFLLLTDSLN